MTSTCSITFNTADNKETERYEVWCVLPDGTKKLVGWSADAENDCIIDIILLMGGEGIRFIDTEEKPDPDKVWGVTKPIGGEE